MTSLETLPAIESQLRRAVAAGAYEPAGLLAARYCEELKKASQPGRMDPLDMARALRHAEALLNWALCAVRVSRAHAGDQLQDLARVLPYCRANTQELHAWQVEG